MPKFDDYWFDEYDGRPPHEGEHGGPHDYPHDHYPHPPFDYPHHHPHPPFDGRRHCPVDMGKVDTTKMHNRYDMFVPYHMPPWGFKFPKLEKAFVPGCTPQEQVAYLLNRVDTMIDYFNHYDDKVWGAYNAVVHSALGNEAYYREITREEGYLADGSTPYTVIHIPYLDRAERPIFLELGLAYNNTTNNGVKENVFEASQNRVADKLIPAFNIADRWEGKAMLKGAPIQSTYTEGKFTLAVTDNGFLKIYPNTVSYDQLNRDRIRNAMGVQGVLINNGAKTPEQYATNGGELLARVGIGMNYETKERLIVIVNGNPTPPNDASVTGATADMLADIFAKYNCTVAVETANNGSAVGMDKGQMIYMPDTATTGVIPTVPSINCYWYITKRRHYHNQYVKDVADLIQKVGQNKWRCEIALQSCDFLKGRVNDLQRDLDAEVQARQDADEQLQNNIDAEAEARRLADEQLQNNINAEAEARRLADEQLQDNIDAEAEARRLADVQLQDNIDAETNARVAGDNALDERITNEVSTLNARIDTVIEDFNNAIATERQARIDGDTTLGTRIDKEVATINARIDTEVATLNALIDAEEQARIAGDTALQNSLTQLREDYTTFLTTYANDLAETRRLTTALRSDITTIQGQIAELQSNLSAVNASITAILATINSIEQSFENIKTAFAGLQEEWHDYKITIMALIDEVRWRTETTEQLLNETVTTVYSQQARGNVAHLSYPELIDSDTITVTFDGVDYVCHKTVVPGVGNVYGASFNLTEGTIDFSEYPFLIGSSIDSNSNPYSMIYTENPSTHAVSVSVKTLTPTDDFTEAVLELIGTGGTLSEYVDYYFDPVNGDDTNDGSESAPFKTINHFNEIAKRNTNNGTYRLHLQPGDYNENVRLSGIDSTIDISVLGRSKDLANFTNGMSIDNCSNVHFMKDELNSEMGTAVFVGSEGAISTLTIDNSYVSFNEFICNAHYNIDLRNATFITNDFVHRGNSSIKLYSIHSDFWAETYERKESQPTESTRFALNLTKWSNAYIGSYSTLGETYITVNTDVSSNILPHTVS